MARLELIVLLALQILLVKSFPADVSTQTMDNPGSKAMDEELDDKEEYDESKGKEYVQEENLGNSHMFEGDIYKDKSTTEIIKTLKNPNGVFRDATTSVVKLWPGAKVPYVFGRVSDLVKSAFKQAIADYNKYSCIRIVPRTSERDFIYVVSEGGCFSALGRSGGSQKLSLGRHCEVKGIAIHELLHALGFFHEHSRLDRDDYVTIHWQNIIPTDVYNFMKYPHGKADYLGEPYDYNSVMHYPKWAFSRNRKNTIVPKRAGVKIGQRRGFSLIDLRQLNKLYKCRVTVIPTEPPTEPCVDSSSQCPSWAKAGYCTKRSYIRYMKKKCRKSCGICTGTGVTPKCGDKRSSCPSWANTGYCKTRSGFMAKHCPRSCNKC